MKRCKGLLVEQGFPEITLHAMSSAIPHALSVLHALIDILPFPKNFVHHDITSHKVTCVDEKKFRTSKGKEWEAVLLDEEEGGETRIQSAVEIKVRVGSPKTIASSSKVTSKEPKKAKPPKIVASKAVSAVQPENPTTSAAPVTASALPDTTANNMDTSVNPKKRKNRPGKASRIAKKRAAESSNGQPVVVIDAPAVAAAEQGDGGGGMDVV